MITKIAKHSFHMTNSIDLPKIEKSKKKQIITTHKQAAETNPKEEEISDF